MPTSTSGPIIPATGNPGDVFHKTSGNDVGTYYCVSPNVWRFCGMCAADGFNTSLFKRGDGTWASPSGGSGGPPTGSIIWWSTGSAPSGYLLCDGSAISRTTFLDLFGVISTSYGSGDGSTTFNVPNLKGRFPVGLDAAQTEFDTLGETGGAKAVTLDSTMIPAHTHGVTDPGHNHTQNAHTHVQDAHTHVQNSHNHTQNSFAPRIINSGTAGTVGVQGASAASNANASNAATTATNQAATATNQNATATNQNATATNNSTTTGISLDNTGGDGAHQNLPPYIVLTAIIKT